MRKAGPRGNSAATTPGTPIRRVRGAGESRSASASLTSVPIYWTTDSGVSVIPDMSRVDEMQKVVDRTWRVKFTRDRAATGTTQVPTAGRVVSVLRVENHENYEKYSQHCKSIRAKRPDGCEPFEVCTGAHLDSGGLQHDINELYLFHGTNPVAADAIAKTDFLLSKAGSAVGMMFGPGIYLAENASKSDEYAKEGDGVFIGQCALLLCRALAGKVLTVQEKGDQSASVKSGEYDSVCGDRLAAVGTFREIIFFDPAAVYTEYIILYSRIYGDETPLPPTVSSASSISSAVGHSPKAAASSPVAASGSRAKRASGDPDPPVVSGQERNLECWFDGCSIRVLPDSSGSSDGCSRGDWAFGWGWKWDPGADGKCQHCPKPESEHHSALKFCMDPCFCSSSDADVGGPCKHCRRAPELHFGLHRFCDRRPCCCICARKKFGGCSKVSSCDQCIRRESAEKSEIAEEVESGDEVDSASDTSTKLCKLHCGRKVAPADDRGRVFDTCCRGCAKGHAHTKACDDNETT